MYESQTCIFERKMKGRGKEKEKKKKDFEDL
jgi:hypothetical protein